MILEITYWNKVADDKLTIEMIEQGERLFVRIYTNDINILNKKIEIKDVENTKEQMNEILDDAEQVNALYINKEYDEFKKKSTALMDKIKLL